MGSRRRPVEAQGAAVMEGMVSREAAVRAVVDAMVKGGQVERLATDTSWEQGVVRARRRADAAIKRHERDLKHKGPQS